LDGLIAIDKPAGMTSHDVVARVRRITGQRSVGHTGTLDPDATGLLAVCLGSAARLTRFMEDLPKEYEAEIVFGVSTHTGDGSGRITERTEGFAIPLSEFLATLGEFLGDIKQIPPIVIMNEAGPVVAVRRLHSRYKPALVQSYMRKEPAL